jgi:hypothetical protein
MPGARCTRDLVCKMYKGRRTRAYRFSGGNLGIPCAMVLRLMARSPRRRIHLVTVIGGLVILPGPVGPAKISTDLTPATGARTTRFCRTQPPAFAETGFVGFWRRSSCARDIAHGTNPPCDFDLAPTLPRPPHPAPTFVTMANAPLSGRDSDGYSGDFGFGKTEIFLRKGLDTPLPTSPR